ncbi:HD phosphohydrolase superfamily protein [Alteracholeplasma palmae J233]|uniref:HD phosphohydrolase superfamily protein n=1 Tax=Alteracholeplasma palmae (strain ATCC 49389 / J233) TaxID=1318466 RepID=U4KNB6_ALTPJ|nr:HD domain-containing protein [Alteracholeplasma palmae]CCV63670.1 HD phosphohydrolase superfamily protein [Alteracholeplasma palmae J233]
MEKLERQQVFRDPIYGYIHIDYAFIENLIDTKVFQRLRRIRQLSGVHMVFHGAEHSRFIHSLGVYELARRFIEIKEINETLSIREQLLFLTAALLHDLGHGAYSHAFEYVFKVNHEKIGAKLIKADQEIGEILDKIDKDFKYDVASIIDKKHKFPIIEQLISSQLDVDRLDYLERDAYFTGAVYGHIDLERLMRIITVKNDKIVFKESGIHAIENYLISRYHMYWQVYYHPKARAFEVILEKIYLRIHDLLESNFDFGHDVTALKRIMEDKNDLEAYREIDDYYMNGLIAHLTKSKDEILSTLSIDFLNRHIWAYLDDTKENAAKIKEIKKEYKDLEKYYTLSTNVEQSAYSETSKNMGDQIYILKKDGNIEPLSAHSSIIHSLITTSIKEDAKFFYKVKK